MTRNLLNTLTHFLKKEKKEFKWSNDLILRPSLFLIYINDLSNNLTSNPNLFTDDISLSSVVQEMINWAFHISDGK